MLPDENSVTKNGSAKNGDRPGKDYSDRLPRTAQVRHYLRQTIYLIAYGIWDRQITLYAFSLTFITLLSVVPILAISVSVSKGMGVPEVARQLAINKFTQAQAAAIGYILEYVENINAGTLGTVGILALLFSVIKSLGYVETALNDIWGVRRDRSIYRKINDYLSIMIVCPILVLSAVGVNTTLSSSTVVHHLMDYALFSNMFTILFAFMPYLALWVAFTFFYVFMPNTRVQLGPAAAAAFIVTLLWQLLQFIYIGFQARLAKQNAIYGALATLPLFMFWTQLSWMITLIGARLAYAFQTGIFYETVDRRYTSFETGQAISLKVLYHIGRAFDLGKKPLNLSDLIRLCRTPALLLEELTYILVKDGFISELEGPERRYQPARPLHKIYLSEVAASLHRRDGYYLEGPPIDDDDKVQRLVAQIGKEMEEKYGRTNLADLIAMESGGDPPKAT
ncbi:MAG: YihY family inner membrane protein [Deltaproteobacteria bacterium]|nr:YihY family inner membrane protein [Deltaproteobacteria bacterium]